MDQFKISTAWYYVPSKSTDRQPVGPFSVDDLRDMFDDEAIDGDTLVCEQREHKWMKLRESTTLYAYVTGGGGGGEPLQQTFPTHVQRTEEIDNGAERATRRVTPPERAPNNAEVKFDEVRETYVYYDDSEEIYFEWDADRKAWIPVIDDVVKQQQQVVYKPMGGGTVRCTSAVSERKGTKRKLEGKGNDEDGEGQIREEDADASVDEEQKMQQLQIFLEATEGSEDAQMQQQQQKSDRKQKKRQRRQSDAGGSGPRISSVYVSNLPLDATIEEMEEVFKKGGLIREDPETREKRIRLYRDKETGEIKGDALVTYARPESVQLAIQLLDGTEFRTEAPTGRLIKVEEARFNAPSSSDTGSGKRDHQQQQQQQQPRSRTSKSKEQLKREQRRLERQLGWDFTEDRFSGQPRTVILKNMFKPSDFSEDPNFGPDLRQEIKEEIEEKVGHVDRIRLFDNHPEGVVEVRFILPAHAQQCIELMHDRWFGGQRISCEMYDGVTSYVVKETLEEQMARLEKFTASMTENEGSEVL